MIDAEDPRYPVADWQYEVANDDTLLGYREWVEAKRAHERGPVLPARFEGEDGWESDFFAAHSYYNSPW